MMEVVWRMRMAGTCGGSLSSSPHAQHGVSIFPWASHRADTPVICRHYHSVPVEEAESGDSCQSDISD